MLLGDVVYEVEDFAACGVVYMRTIGRKAIETLRSDPHLGTLPVDEEDTWDASSSPLVTMLGMCLAMCQVIEYYIYNSFLLGISKSQKKKCETLNDLRNGWKKKTLGQMLKSTEEAWDIEPTLKTNLELFLANRNRLVHGITVEERFDIRTHWGREELVAFLAFFDIQGRIVKRAFKASFYASLMFAFNNWGRPPEISRKVFGRKHEKEAAMFFQFFRVKEDAI